MIKFLGRIIFSAFLLAFAWLYGLIWFVAQMPNNAPLSPRQAGAIVVLTGGTGRLEHGIRLMLEGRSEKLFISGANQVVTYDDVVRLSPAHARNRVRGLTRGRIILGNNAENTIGNAEEVKIWLANERYQSILLVTSAYHMPRSLSEFQELMPQLRVIPEPVISPDFKASWWTKRDSLKIVLSEYHKYLISKFRHWFIRTPLFNAL